MLTTSDRMNFWLFRIRWRRDTFESPCEWRSDSQDLNLAKKQNDFIFQSPLRFRKYCPDDIVSDAWSELNLVEEFRGWILGFNAFVVQA